MNFKNLKLKIHIFVPILGFGLTPNLLKMKKFVIKKGHIYKGLSKYSCNKSTLMVRNTRG
jgi:hypothetical protein